jgi:DNA-directed RNA polymerase beta' subunit
MRVREVRPYCPSAGRDSLADVYDITVADVHLYAVCGVLVSNSKRLSMLDVNALMSHGATETLRDARLIRGQKNEQFWLQFMLGFTPVKPKVPYVYDKFVHQLKAAGINVVPDGHRANVMALTDQDVKELAGNRIIRSGELVRFDDNMSPIPGGLFDPKLTGGHGGRRWAAIELPEPLPNPVMEEPIRRILGLTQKKFEAVLAGDESLPGYGSGPQAVAKALDQLDLDKELDKARAEWRYGRASHRDEAIRRWQYLDSAKKLGLHPRDWVLHRVPVLPPAFRPVSMLGDTGIPLISDPNYLYKELLDAIRNYNDMVKQVGKKNAGPERLAVYHAFQAVVGLGEPMHPKLQEKGVSGILKSIFGESPKFGTMQRKLLSTTVDNVGRAVITPDPDMDMDSIGIPENQAFDVYSKFIVRRLRRRGLPIREALRHVRERTPLARSIMQEEMEERPVYVNRAPVLHKFGILAFRPRLVSGNTIHLSPLVTKGFNADFDGDAMQFHVPTSPEAVKEAYDRLLPSRSLFSPADFQSPVHMPGQEYLGGLYESTRRRSVSRKRPRVFRSRQDAIRAYRRGEITVDTPVEILGG